MTIRPTRNTDLPDLGRVLDETELFPSELLPELIEGYLAGDEDSAIWLTAEDDGQILGFCYAIAEPLTEGTWNMLAIAVATDAQGSGAGSALLSALEEKLRGLGQRIVIADTSGLPAFEATREFYRGNGYTEEARVRAFWGPGDDKVTFWKSLA